MDDDSRLTRLFVLKDRSELPTIFMTLYKEILTHFDKKIKILHPGHALERAKSNSTNFSGVKKGIFHYTTCPLTSQQNGVVEHKHRHWLDVAHTLKFTTHVPKTFWADAILPHVS